MSINSFVFPASGLGYDRSACIAAFSGITPAAGLTNLVTASYETGNIYTYGTGVSGLVPLPTPNGSGILFGDSIYQFLSGQIPTALSNGGIEFLSGATGGIEWVNASVSTGHSLQVQCVAPSGTDGGLLGFNSVIPDVSLTILGNEIFQINYQLEDNIPEEILLQFYESSVGWHTVYLGTDQFLFGGFNAGSIPITIGSWLSFTVTAAQLGLSQGMVVTGFSWGVWSPTNTTCNVLFSDIINLNASPITQFVDCDQDGNTGFYVLYRQGLIHTPQITIPPITSAVIPFPTSPSFIYTGLTYDAPKGLAYVIGYDGSVYSYNGTVVSTVTGPPSGVSAPARQLYNDGNNLYTLFANSSGIAAYAIGSNTWSLETAFPFSGPTWTMYYSKDIGKLLAAGGNYLDTAFAGTISDLGFAFNPNQLVVATSVSNATGFYNLVNNKWILSQSIAGTGTPNKVATEPDGLQVLVTDTANNVIQVLTNIAGFWSATSTVSLTGPTSIATYTSAITQAIVCQPSNNTVTILNKSVTTWSVSQTLSITNPTDVAISATAAGIFAVVTTSAGITNLEFDGVLWSIKNSIALSPAPTQAASDYVSTANSNLYVAGSSGGNTTVTIINNNAVVGTYTFADTLGELSVVNDQIFIFTASDRIYGGYSVGSLTGNALVSGVLGPANPIANTWVPIIGDYLPSLVVANTTDMFTFNVSKPQTVVRTTDSSLAILTSGTWSTIDLVDSNPVSSITTDVSGNIYALTIDNDLYKIQSQTTIASGYPYTLSPPTNQEQAVTLGLSRLLWWSNSIYSSSSLMGGITIINPS